MDPLKNAPVPLFDNLEHLSPALNATHIKITNASEDYFQAVQFLRSYRGSPDTFSSYRREIERFLQWSWCVLGKTLKHLKRAEIEAFIEFCQKPPLTWIGTKNVSRFLDKNGLRAPNPEWRPFVSSVSKVAFSRGESPETKKYTISQKTLQAIFSILGSFYNYLIQEEYTEINPVTQIRQKSKFLRKYQNKSIIRRLSEIQWRYVIETTEQMANENPETHERTLFIMSALYAMYLRISELAASKRWQPQMGHFQKDRYGNWWFITVGKGNKERMITVSDDMLAALKRYRQSLNLTPLPYTGETTPLLLKKRGTGPINTTRQIRSIVQACFDKAIQRLLKDHLKDEAEQLKAATVHWLRHTGISDDIKHRPQADVRDDAGHQNIATTSKYIDIGLRERHASGKRKKIK